MSEMISYWPENTSIKDYAFFMRGVLLLQLAINIGASIWASQMDAMNATLHTTMPGIATVVGINMIATAFAGIAACRSQLLMNAGFSNEQEYTESMLVNAKN